MINQMKSIGQVKEHLPNIFWSNLNLGVITVSGLTISVVFVRFAGKELYGQYLFVLAIFGLLSIVSIPGVRTVVFRTTAQDYDGVYRKATAFSFLWGVLGIPLLLITGVFFYLFRAKILGISLVSCALLFPFVTSLQTWVQFLKGRSGFKQLTINNSAKLSVKLVAITLSIILSKNIIVILLTCLLVESGFNILYHSKILSSLRNDELDMGWKRQSYALTIMDLSAMVFGQVDIILIAALLPIGQVAIYGLVMKLGNVFLQAVKSTVDVILPKLYKSEKINVGYFYKFFLLSFLIPIVLYPIIRYLVLFLYGQDYSELVFFSQVYLTIVPIFFLHSIAMNFMVKHKLNKEINISKIVAIIAVLALYSILIPLYGVWGGIISSMLYFIIQLVINLYLLRVGKSKYSRPSEDVQVIL